MIVSWNWLKDYVSPSLNPEEVAQRLTMSGMNLESIEPQGQDFAIDLEITSNRPDCLGHLGVAREVGVVCKTSFKTPDPQPAQTGPRAESVASVEVEAPNDCPQYIARVIRNVKIGPSPVWMQERLLAIGVNPVNNVVDVTNYVLMECGQPLHAFDLDRLGGKRIVVRNARAGEQLEAIDHKTYRLSPEMCVIADASRPVAVAGVMGGAATEVQEGTRNLLIESAAFRPGSVRSTARVLNLHSASSYRFERGVDPQGVEWASRRCCELILQTAGGELLEGRIAVEQISNAAGEPVTLRFARVAHIVGIEIPEERCVEILSALGLRKVGHRAGVDSSWEAPSWRRDLTREIDLVEEVARVHGYDHIPENATLPTAAVSIRPQDVVRRRIESVLTTARFHEAITFSFTTDEVAAVFTPPDAPAPLHIAMTAGEYGSRLRQSLIPSLLLSRRENERQGVHDADLFEIARVFLGTDPSQEGSQPIRLALITGHDFRWLKGVIETIVQALNPEAKLTVEPLDVAGFQSGRGASLLLNGTPCGWIGELDREGHQPLRELKLRDNVTAAELDFTALTVLGKYERKQQPLPEFPAVERDFNFVFDDAVTWDAVAEVVKASAGPHLENLTFVDRYVGKQIPAGKKSYVMKLVYRAADRTLTGGEVDAAQTAVQEAVQTRLGAVQR